MENIVVYLSVKRSFLFLDEWLSYYLLYDMYNTQNYYLFTIASIMAILFNGYGYKCYWELEEAFNGYLMKKLK
tara:strand:- start:155 stop:373 length:219 start_codon:yes stop_codon:yes gene_type:complete